jgi:hypothetical protein
LELNTVILGSVIQLYRNVLFKKLLEGQWLGDAHVLKAIRFEKLFVGQF